MDYRTELSKGRDGWKAQTEIVLPDVKAYATRDGKPGETKLSVSTSKRSRGGLSTYASVAFYSADHFTVHALGMGTGRGDYGRTVLQSPDRCTEKAITLLHAEALKLVPTVLAEVRAHYDALEARRIADAQARA